MLSDNRTEYKTRDRSDRAAPMHNTGRQRLFRPSLDSGNGTAQTTARVLVAHPAGRGMITQHATGKPQEALPFGPHHQPAESSFHVSPHPSDYSMGVRAASTSSTPYGRMDSSLRRDPSLDHSNMFAGGVAGSGAGHMPAPPKGSATSGSSMQGARGAMRGDHRGR